MLVKLENPKEYAADGIWVGIVDAVQDGMMEWLRAAVVGGEELSAPLFRKPRDVRDLAIPKVAGVLVLRGQFAVLNGAPSYKDFLQWIRVLMMWGPSQTQHTRIYRVNN